MSNVPPKSKNNGRTSRVNVIHRTTSETLRLTDSECNNKSSRTAMSNQPSRKKPSSSFQVTGVSVISGDGGDDSTDDLDESRTDETSFSDDTYSRDADEVHTPCTINNMLHSPKVTSPVPSGGINNVDVITAISTVTTEESTVPAPTSSKTFGDRFKVVKIESTVPFYRGRWTCMDYLDHSVHTPKDAYVYCQHQQQYVKAPALQTCNQSPRSTTVVPNTSCQGHSYSGISHFSVQTKSRYIPAQTFPTQPQDNMVSDVQDFLKTNKNQDKSVFEQSDASAQKVTPRVQKQDTSFTRHLQGTPHFSSPKIDIIGQAFPFNVTNVQNQLPAYLPQNCFVSSDYQQRYPQNYYPTYMPPVSLQTSSQYSPAIYMHHQEYGLCAQGQFGSQIASTSASPPFHYQLPWIFQLNVPPNSEIGAATSNIPQTIISTTANYNYNCAPTYQRLPASSQGLVPSYEGFQAAYFSKNYTATKPQFQKGIAQNPVAIQQSFPTVMTSSPFSNNMCQNANFKSCNVSQQIPCLTQLSSCEKNAMNKDALFKKQQPVALKDASVVQTKAFDSYFTSNASVMCGGSVVSSGVSNLTMLNNNNSNNIKAHCVVTEPFVCTIMTLNDNTTVTFSNQVTKPSVPTVMSSLNNNGIVMSAIQVTNKSSDPIVTTVNNNSAVASYQITKPSILSEDTESVSGASTVAIDNKIAQAMDLVKSHLMYAVREEVEVLKERISELLDRINQLEVENSFLRANASAEVLSALNDRAAQSQQEEGPNKSSPTTSGGPANN